MMLVPIYFLIALWGHKGAEGKSRVYAATKFFIYTQVAGLIMSIWYPRPRGLWLHDDRYDRF